MNVNFQTVSNGHHDISMPDIRELKRMLPFFGKRYMQ